jgi:hypothetical protein
MQLVANTNEVQSTRRRFRFASHVAACSTANCAVLLDLKRDKYVGVGPAEARVLSNFIVDWPTDTVRSNISIGTNASAFVASNETQEPAHLIDGIDRDSEAVLAELISASMLVQNGEVTVFPEHIELDPPEVSLLRPSAEEIPRLSVSDVIHFVTSVAVTRCRLRLFSLHHVTSRTRARRVKLTKRSKQPTNMTQARIRVINFKRLSPLLFRARRACLFDSLALGEFLFRFGIAANIVIGVKLSPFFSAHCWVQYENVVFNDDPATVASYKPILTL